MYKRLATNTVVNILNLITNIVINFALAPFFIRSLGDEVYGVWVFVASLSVLRGFLRVFDLGVQSSLVKYVAEYDARGDRQGVNQVVSASVMFYGVIGSVVALALILLTNAGALALFSIPESQIDTARLLLLLMALQTIMDFLGMSTFGLLEGLQRYDITRGYNILRLVIFAAASLMMLNAGFGVYALPAATFLSESARLIGHVYWIQRLVPALRLTYHVSRDVLRAMFSLSSKVFVYALANTVYEQMDKIIIATLLTTTLLTDYDISYRLHTLVFALTTMISPFLVPAASSLQAINDTRELHRLFVRVTLYTAALTVPAALLVIVLAQPLTVYWIGVDYAHTVPATQLFISYLLFWFILRIGQNMLVGINQLDVVIPAFILTTIINLLVSVTLVPSLGVMGVIVGTVCGNLIALVPYLRAFRQHFNLTLHDILSGVVLRVYPQALVSAGAVLGLTQLHTPGNLFEVGLYGAGGLMGFALLFFLTGMPSDEKQLLQRFATRFNPVR